MKRLYFLSVLTFIATLIGSCSFEASASGRRIVHSGNAKAVGGNGGSAKGTGAKAGNGGDAAAHAGSVFGKKSSGAIINSGNASATGGNGGNASGTGAKAGNGGSAAAKAGDIGFNPTKLKGKGKAGGGTGGQASAGSGNASATGGNGGSASGTGAKGGNGGDAIAVSGNGNTVVNGNNNTIIGKVVNNNISLNIGGGGFGGLGGGFGGGSGGGFGGGFVTDGGAFAQGGYGGDGVVQGAPGTAVASSPSDTVITTDGSPAVAKGQDGKDNVEDGEKESVFTRRYLKVKNDSGLAMKVYVQYRGMDDKKWAWLPADPSQSKDAVVYDLEPGQELFLNHKDKKLEASRVRIWGVAGSQNWFDFRDQDLWVVPEMDQRGEHRYISTEMRTFTFVFPKKTSEVSK